MSEAMGWSKSSAQFDPGWSTNIFKSFAYRLAARWHALARTEPHLNREPRCCPAKRNSRTARRAYGEQVVPAMACLAYPHATAIGPKSLALCVISGCVLVGVACSVEPT